MLQNHIKMLKITQGKKFKILILILAFVLIFGTHLKFSPDNNDLWLHLVSGKVISESNSVPKTDVLTFTKQGEEWSVHEWLYQSTGYFIYKHFGLTGLLVIKSLFVCLCLALLFYLIKDSFYIGLFVTLLVSYGLTLFSDIRPHVLSWVFLIFTLILIKKNKEWFLPALILLWGNLHPLHLIGLVIIALYLGPKYLKTKNKKYLFVMILSVIAAALNPMGIKTFFVPFNIISPFITEWKPFSPAGLYFWIFGAFILLGILSFVKKRKLNISDAMLFILLTYLGYSSRRHVAQAFILLTPIIINNFQFRFKFLFERDLKKDIMFVVIIALLLFTGITYWGAFNTNFPWHKYPILETKIIEEHNIKGNIFNRYGFGSFLEFYLYPSNLVYIDARAETMGKELINEYVSLGTNKKEDIPKIIEKNNITIVIVAHDMNIGNYFLNHPDWKLINVNDEWASFVLNTEETKNVPEIDLSSSKYVQLD
ncbi:hypothetical protein HN695_07815 [Candidatus Woesearchaeota archaeon]|jgi:hypothetical protein|nr:hypothetical protein [Candidatus Woesearchaeota archaeon]MBT5272422.1 hypothetical protein [Candidatus Woesearchaeota archaeon]MBT6041236.1 hypothetical protein [Candidatus Woesearchaeota archaeon]MBT7928211.1 hypothetical protein [Candidatus Woesearchaeota archaeon]